VTITDVLVIGAGPAGLGAAIEARRTGASVTLIDEYPQPGGQFYRQPIRGHGSGHAREGAQLIAEVAAAGVDIRTDALVWGLADDRGVEVLHHRIREQIHARTVVIATGAVERVIPFPGWTLPGVFSAGGAQAIVKSSGVAPGGRVIVAGSGPFLFPVATELAISGTKVVGVFEATDLSSLARGTRRVGGHWARLRQALGYAVTLRRNGVPVRFGRRVVAVEGGSTAQRAIVAKVDHHWRPIAGSERSIEVDAVCVGDGFVPATQLPRLFGCAQEYRPHGGGWCTVHDLHQETSVADIFIAGEAGGIAGAHAALASGRIAGFAAAYRARGEALSLCDTRDLRRGLARHRRFSALLDSLYRIPREAYAAIPDGVVVCRCEDVTAGEIRKASCAWSAEANVIKGVTRAGMGRCQGRTCAPSVASIIAQSTGASEHVVGSFRVRAPIKPIPLRSLVEEPSAK